MEPRNALIQIAIVEDAASDRKKLQDFVERFFGERGQTVKIFLFSDGTEFLDDYPSLLDIAFLDIEMKQVDGIRTACMLREWDRRVLLAFVTNMAHLALEGYAVDAADFIVKPLDYGGFSAHMDMLMASVLPKRLGNLLVGNKNITALLIINQISPLNRIPCCNRQQAYPQPWIFQSGAAG